MYRLHYKPRIMADETLTVRRYDRAFGGRVNVVDGLRVFEDQPYRTFQATGSLQPVSGEDLVQPAEGTYQTTRLVWYVWIDGPDVPQAGDYVERESLYIVASAEQWGSHVRLSLSRDDKARTRL